jgi:hypothetical protein
LRTIRPKESIHVFELQHDHGAERGRFSGISKLSFDPFLAPPVRWAADQSHGTHQRLCGTRKRERSGAATLSEHGGPWALDCDVEGRNAGWTGAPTAPVGAAHLGNAISRKVMEFVAVGGSTAASFDINFD